MPVLPARRHDGDRHGLRLDRQGGLDARLGRGDRDGRDALHGAARSSACRTSTSRNRCGQCTPCREGTGWLYRMVHRIEHGEGRPEDLDLLNSRRRQHPGPHHLRAGRRGGACRCALHQALPRRVRAPHRAQALPRAASTCDARDMAKLEIDGKKVEVPEGSTLMDAANKLGIYVPHFCYHKKLSIAANCRMCLVQVEKAPKPLPACATPVDQGHEGRAPHSRARNQGAEGRDGVPADQPSARLPDLRPGRRMPAAGPRGRLRRLGSSRYAEPSASCSTRTWAR